MATPPASRWVQFAYAIEKGLHVFMKKPTTVDAPTTLKMLELAKKSVDKNLKGEDLGSLDGLFRQFWGESSELDKMAVMFDRLSKDRHYVLLAAKQDDVLVGFCMGIVCQSLYGDCSPFMVIEDFVVDEQCRRTGIGTALMSAAEQHAAHRGCSQVIFVTENDRKDARGFYASQGYSPDTHTGFKKRLSGQ